MTKVIMNSTVKHAHDRLMELRKSGIAHNAETVKLERFIIEYNKGELKSLDESEESVYSIIASEINQKNSE